MSMAVKGRRQQQCGSKKLDVALCEASLVLQAATKNVSSQVLPDPGEKAGCLDWQNPG